VVRGFNHRKDLMNKYDRQQMTNEFIRICKQIASENGFSAIYIPPQTGWHALSNRDGMVKEINKIAKKNRKEINKRKNHPLLKISDAKFNPSNKGFDFRLLPLNLLWAE